LTLVDKTLKFLQSTHWLGKLWQFWCPGTRDRNRLGRKLWQFWCPGTRDRNRSGRSTETYGL